MLRHAVKQATGLVAMGLLGVPSCFGQTPTPPVAAAAGATASAVQSPQASAAAEEAARAKTAQDSAADHADMMRQLGMTNLRHGADGNATSVFAANYDDAKVPAFSLPDPLLLDNGKPVRSAKVWWEQRRPQIVDQLETSMYGRVPVNTPDVQWSVVSTTDSTEGGVEAVTRRLRGHVDNSADPAITVNIDVDLTLPAHADGRVPVMIAFDWPPEFFAAMAKRMGRAMPAPTGPTARQQVLAKGWGYALLIPTSVQADNGAGLTGGIIGLCNKGARRTPEQWGALRAWGWGAGHLLDYFETLPEVDAKRVGIFGHSRYGKAALVTMAFDRRFAIGYISSSGEAGAKLSRRQFGELVENVAGDQEYHWMAGNFLKYAGPLTANDLPVDAHDLIALCAPRPLFLGAGATHGDGWADAEGQFQAAVAASPVYHLLGAGGLPTTTMPPQLSEVGGGALAFRQHSEGHTPAPNWPFFLDFAQTQLAIRDNTEHSKPRRSGNSVSPPVSERPQRPY